MLCLSALFILFIYETIIDFTLAFTITYIVPVASLPFSSISSIIFRILSKISEVSLRHSTQYFQNTKTRPQVICRRSCLSVVSRQKSVGEKHKISHSIQEMINRRQQILLYEKFTNSNNNNNNVIFIVLKVSLQIGPQFIVH